jgi:two-component system, NtrC family, sensor kinase
MRVQRVRSISGWARFLRPKKQVQVQPQRILRSRKAPIVLIVTLILVLATLYSVSSNILLNSFVTIERQTIQQYVSRVLGVLSNELDNLSTTTGDYARWDDTYGFMNGRNEDYIDLNLSSATFTSLNLDLVAFESSARQVTLDFDQATTKVKVSDPFTANSLASYPALFHFNDLTDSQLGIIRLPKGAMMIAARPILTSEGKGPIAGTLLMGRYFDEQLTQQLGSLAQVSLTAYLSNAPNLPAEVEQARQALIAGESVFVEPLSPKSIAGYALLNDIAGNPAILLRIDMSRRIYQQGLLSLRYLATSLLFVGIGAGILLWLMFQKLLEHVTERDRMQHALEQESALRKSDMQYRQKAQELEQALFALQETQAQLVQSEKMSGLGQLVAGVAHEINNPVNFIYGNIVYAQEYWQVLQRLLQLYRHHYPDPAPSIQEQLKDIDLEFLSEDFAKILNSMKVGSERIRQTVLSLRNFSRLDEAEMKPVDIHEGIDNTLVILQNQLKEQSYRPAITLIKTYGDLPLVDCYAGQLNQVFMNLLVNSIHALDEQVERQQSQKRGVLQTKIDVVQSDASSSVLSALNQVHKAFWTPTIWITTEVVAEHDVVIRIADNGIGMAKEIQRRLFDPFFTTKPIGKGTGLGLSISYSIVTEQHHGHIYCVSEPGQGTEFIVKIPIQQHQDID